ncbi:hypothetical protein PLICRDRAFT_702210 [Plicaturopsis crispa FD-325 SS-3]|uniref:DUF6534 domain-containing protein n=1 Tax=Plicaturopsis crispa FD-325 SS-3 TaxID=944288 RepID=A0A0C9SWU3_PLICR|nr:hypothetical protein PLICRDRAFT_702210 [Plicaturopsis crispa FD-325 SS-3]
MSTDRSMYSTLGASEIGALLSMGLSGIVVAQVYTYARRFSNDPVWLRIFVCAISCVHRYTALPPLSLFDENTHRICELAYTILLMIAMHAISVTAAARIPASVYMCMLVGSITGILTQVFFARRIWILSGKPYITFACWVLAAFRLVSSVVSAVSSFRTAPNWGDYVVSGTRTFVTVLSGAFAGHPTDGCRDRQTHSVDRSNGSHDKARLRWQSYTLPHAHETYTTVNSSASMAILILLVTAPDNYAWLAVLICFPRLFSISLLTSLNARAAFREDLESTLPMESIRFPQVPAAPSDIMCHAVEEPRYPTEAL